MIAYLHVPNSRGLALQSAINAAGITTDQTVNVYQDAPNLVNDFGLRDVPALALVVDGRAIYQVSEPEQVATWPADAAASLAAYEATHPNG